jgi:ADP-ribose pyrophosphatase
MSKLSHERLGGRDASPMILGSEQVYSGRIVKVRRDEIQFPAGRLATREVVETTDAVAIVALDSQSRVCLLRQYRHPQGAYIWEIPAGRLDVPNEEPLVTAKRELLEEAGLIAQNWTPLIVAISSAGLATERTHIFLATGIRSATKPQDFRPSAEEQDIEMVLRPIEEVISDINLGALTDAKTVIGVLLTHGKTH